MNKKRSLNKKKKVWKTEKKDFWRREKLLENKNKNKEKKNLKNSKNLMMRLTKINKKLNKSLTRMIFFLHLLLNQKNQSLRPSKSRKRKNRKGLDY